MNQPRRNNLIRPRTRNKPSIPLPERANSDGPTQWMHNLVSTWLSRRDWQPEELIAWLQGYNLPPVGHDDEPYLWLLRGLPPGHDEMRVELARRVAVVLGGQPDVRRPGKRPEQVLYNLLMLCAGLNSPAILAEPLYEIFERKKLVGQWLGLGLRERLRDALMENQVDDRLQVVWERMLSGLRDEFLPGNRNDGLAGVECLLRLADIRIVGPVLTATLKHLDPVHSRRPEFRRLVGKVAEAAPSWLDRSRFSLLKQADQHQWPSWAVSCIPSLPSPKEVVADKLIPLWEVFIPLLDARKYPYKSEKVLCGEVVNLVRLSGEAASFLDLIVASVEEQRLELPFRNYRAVLAGATYMIDECKIILEYRVSGALEQLKRKEDLQLQFNENLTALQRGREAIVSKNFLPQGD